MRRLKALLVTSAGAALLLTALGSPAGAATPDRGRISFVNGIPGTKVDVCVNGKEIRSSLRYGGVKTRIFGIGPKTAKFFKADPRRCKGKLLGKAGGDLKDGDDMTIVVTKKKPDKVVIFENQDLGAIPSASHWVAMTFRHAADLGRATFRFSQIVRTPEQAPPVTPAADPVYRKGDEHVSSTTAMFPGRVWIRSRVTRPDKRQTIAGPKTLELKYDRRHEWILVGTTPRNARIVTFRVPIVDPTP
jgi:hypothetical protein